MEGGDGCSGGEGEMKTENVRLPEDREGEGQSTTIIGERNGVRLESVFSGFFVPSVVAGTVFSASFDIEQSQGGTGWNDGFIL